MKWITSRQPWRTPEVIYEIVVVGSTAIAFGADDWIGAIDLTSGKVVREATVAGVSISDVAKLADGRVLAVGTRERMPRAIVIDPATLASKTVELGPPAVSIRAAVAPDGSVVIAAYGAPLAVYDPSTWTRSRELAPADEWRELFVTTDTVYVRSGRRSPQWFSVPLAGGQLVPAPRGFVMAAGSTVVRQNPPASRISRSIGEAQTGNGPWVALGKLEYNSALDATGKWLANDTGDTVRVISLVDGTLAARLDLGPRHARGVLPRFAFAEGRLVVADDAAVRVIDLATDKATPPGDAPHDLIDQIVVGNDGSVITLGLERTKIVAGELIASELLRGKPARMTASESGTYATIAPLSREPAEPSAEIVVVNGNGRTNTKRWGTRFSGHPFRAWVGAKGTVAAAVTGFFDPTVTWFDGELALLVPGTADIDDVDVDAGVVAITDASTTRLIPLSTGASPLSELRGPACSHRQARLEYSGSRVVTFDHEAVVLWDRASGRRLASLRHDSASGEPTFVPRRDDIVVPTRDGFIVWSPNTREQRVVRAPGLAHIAASADGKLLGLAFTDGRVALVDFAAMRAALPAGVASAEVPTPCREAK